MSAGIFSEDLAPPPPPLDKTFLWRTIVAPSLTFGAGVVLLRPEDVTELDRFQGRRLNALGSLANFRWLGEGGRISPPPPWLTSELIGGARSAVGVPHRRCGRERFAPPPPPAWSIGR